MGEERINCCILLFYRGSLVWRRVEISGALWIRHMEGLKKGCFYCCTHACTFQTYRARDKKAWYAHSSLRWWLSCGEPPVGSQFRPCLQWVRFCVPVEKEMWLLSCGSWTCGGRKQCARNEVVFWAAFDVFPSYFTPSKNSSKIWTT